jgi:hypothetical protein
LTGTLGQRQAERHRERTGQSDDGRASGAGRLADQVASALIEHIQFGEQTLARFYDVTVERIVSRVGHDA